MVLKKSKKQSDNSNKEASKPGSQVQEATEEQSSKLLQENSSLVTSTDPPAASDSTTPKHYKAPINDSYIQKSKLIDTLYIITEEELYKTSKELKILQLQLYLYTLKAKVA